MRFSLLPLLWSCQITQFSVSHWEDPLSNDGKVHHKFVSTMLENRTFTNHVLIVCIFTKKKTCQQHEDDLWVLEAGKKERAKQKIKHVQQTALIQNYRIRAPVLHRGREGGREIICVLPLNHGLLTYPSDRTLNGFPNKSSLQWICFPFTKVKVAFIKFHIEKMLPHVTIHLSS